MSWAYHTNLFGPIANWPLNGTLTDVSGNGLNLTVEAGLQRDDDLVPGHLCTWFNAASRLLAPADARLLLTGDCGVGMYVRPTRYPTNAAGFELLTIGVPNTEGSEANNFLLRVLLAQTTNQIVVAWETTAMADVTTNTSAALVAGVPVHLFVRRLGLTIDVFLNRELIATATASAAPTGGANGRLRLGGGTTNASYEGCMSSVVVFNYALTDEEIADLGTDPVELPFTIQPDRGPYTGGTFVQVTGSAIDMTEVSDGFTGSVLSGMWTNLSTGTGTAVQRAADNVVVLDTGTTANSIAGIRQITADPVQDVDTSAQFKLLVDSRPLSNHAVRTVIAEIAIAAVSGNNRTSIQIGLSTLGVDARLLTYSSGGLTASNTKVIAPARRLRTPIEIRLLRALSKTFAFVNGALFGTVDWFNGDARLEFLVRNDTAVSTRVQTELSNFARRPVIRFGNDPMLDFVARGEQHGFGSTPAVSVLRETVDISVTGVEGAPMEIVTNGFTFTRPDNLIDLKATSSIRLMTFADPQLTRKP